MLVKPPINSRITVLKNVVLIRLIPLQNVAHSIAEFPKVSGHEMAIAV